MSILRSFIHTKMSSNRICYCFRKAGFSSRMNDKDILDSESVAFDDYVNMDYEVTTSSIFTDKEIVKEIKKSRQPEAADNCKK